MLRVSIAVAAVLCLASADARTPHLSPPATGSAREKPSNWVVITTINYPTETVKALAKAPGWQVVVVADQKTPQDWQLNDVDVLDVEKQKTLNYKILPLLPYNHYGWAPFYLSTTDKDLHRHRLKL